jgi:hypothetical protein
MTCVGRRLFLAAAVAVALSGCLSPTLPLPPPSKPTVTGPDEKGLVTLDGNVLSGASVYAANTRTGEIRGQLYTGNDGHYTILIAAQVGDEMEVWYSVGTDQSPNIVFRIE